MGQIFLNTSLTEAFCMSIVEAASCGLHIVSTRVGGIPEVLPEEFIVTRQPLADADLSDALLEAIRLREEGQLMAPEEKHAAVSNMYHWPEVAKRTERVYRSALRCPQFSWFQRILRYCHGGFGLGILYVWAAVLNMLFIVVLDYFDRIQASFAES
ncbi:unnamed protein product [Gongylonema pulchrum]|uniref:Glycos_transf_1 domain-containing protein n=1 Tax=Gongylonema pulchrum TaxID=637853 RepID=A0A183CYH8_9BILA|nr:unnamed protein product [Gongylonema pulchrum]